VLRIEFFGDEVERITTIDPLTGEQLSELRAARRLPGHPLRHPPSACARRWPASRTSCRSGCRVRAENDKLLEAQRLEQRTQYDLEMMSEIGYCNGIENYSMHLDGREPGEPPPPCSTTSPTTTCSSSTSPRRRAAAARRMYRGDRSRKETLVEHGFRLPSALDNRPLKFEEFSSGQPVRLRVGHPGDYELEQVRGRGRRADHPPHRPARPEVEVRPTKGQIDDLLDEIRARVARGERVLVTTLTKRWPRTSPTTCGSQGVRVRYLHSTSTPSSASRSCAGCASATSTCSSASTCCARASTCPRCRWCAILDADKEGFLRSRRR
jgi:excinuclease ABC subunit B